MSGEYWRQIEAARKKQLDEQVGLIPQEERERILTSASDIVVAIFKEIEIYSPKVKSARRHVVICKIHEPYQDQASVDLLWGEKFELTESERELIRKFQEESATLSFRPGDYPESILEFSCSFISAILDSVKGTLMLTDSPTYGLYEFNRNYRIVIPHLATLIKNPPITSQTLYRKYGYGEPAYTLEPELI